jgi:hypothetical protein
MLSRMMNGPLRFPILAAAAVALLGACSSADKNKDKQTSQKPMSDSMRSRMMNTDMTKRSSFESAMVSQNSGAGSYMEKQGYKAKDYAGNTKFRVPKTLKQDAYAGNTDLSPMGSQKFTGSGEPNRLGSKRFAAGEAREGSQTARQQDQVFAGGNDTFKTGAVRDAARSQTENKRPLIVKPDGGMADETPYTEDQIRQMVNRR